MESAVAGLSSEHEFSLLLPFALSALALVAAIRIAMDDFGTGYSSLAYLQSFPFDRLKIDRQFVADLETSPQSEAIVKAVIGLGHGLGLPVIAEGVETRRQLDMLREMGCDQVQGFLMGRPQPISFYRDQVSPASRRDQSGVAAA